MHQHLIGPQTPRLSHRAFCPDDAPTFYRLNSHPEVMRYTCEPMLTSEDEARRAIQAYPDFERHGFGRWACVQKSDNAIIGFCGLKYLEEFDAVDVGYRFFPQYWGMGIATEACRVCVEFGFDVLKLPRILGFVKPENTASIRVLEKVGFHDRGMTTCGSDSALRFEMESPLARDEAND